MVGKIVQSGGRMRGVKIGAIPRILLMWWYAGGAGKGNSLRG